MWDTTRVPLVTSLVGHANETSVRLNEETIIAMATKHYPLTLHWLTAILGFYENMKNGANVLRDCKEHNSIKNSVGLPINE